MRTALLLIMFLFWSAMANAQTVRPGEVTYRPIGSFSVRNAGALYRGDSVRGYYLLTRSEGPENDSFRYELHLLDSTLQPIRSLHFNERAPAQVLEMGWDGRFFVFHVYDPNFMTAYGRVFDDHGLEYTGYKVKFSKKTDQYFNNKQRFDPHTEPDAPPDYLFPVKGGGFGLLLPFVQNKRPTYEFRYFDPADSTKNWSYIAPDTFRLGCRVRLLSADTNQVLLVQKANGNQLVKTLGIVVASPQTLLSFDRKDGHLLFSRSLRQKQQELYPSFARPLPGDSTEIFGTGCIIKIDGSRGPFGAFRLQMPLGGTIEPAQLALFRDIDTLAGLRKRGVFGKYSLIQVHQVFTVGGRDILFAECYAVTTGVGNITDILVVGAETAMGMPPLVSLLTMEPTSRLRLSDCVLLEIDTIGQFTKAFVLPKFDHQVNPDFTEKMTVLEAGQEAAQLGLFERIPVRGNSFAFRDGKPGRERWGVTYRHNYLLPGAELLRKELIWKTEATAYRFLQGSGGTACVLEWFENEYKLVLSRHNLQPSSLK